MGAPFSWIARLKQNILPLRDTGTRWVGKSINIRPRNVFVAMYWFYILFTWDLVHWTARCALRLQTSTWQNPLSLPRGPQDPEAGSTRRSRYQNTAGSSINIRGLSSSCLRYRAGWSNSKRLSSCLAARGRICAVGAGKVYTFVWVTPYTFVESETMVSIC